MQSLPETLASRFKSLGFAELTEIQRRAVPAIYQKKNALVMAPTGSGKTECAVIPIFERIKNTRRDGSIKALYITPLRALNKDVFRRVENYAQDSGLSIKIRHGDTTQSEKRKITKNPPDILITTPETLVALLIQDAALKALRDIEWVILDEVHEMLSSERGSQLSIALERLQYNAGTEITRIGLSATVSNAQDAAKFVAGTKRKCKVIRDKKLRKYDVERRYVSGSMEDAADEILRYVSETGTKAPVLLFANARGEAEKLASILRKNSRYAVEMHHGSLSKHVREETESALRAGTQSITVCTSSLELGLDIGSVETVIHYGSPKQASKLMQRIGRSRHSGGASAKGLIVTDKPADDIESRAVLRQAAKGAIEKQRIHENSLDVAAHHAAGLALQLGRVSVAKALSIFRMAYPFRSLALEDIVSVLEMLDESRVILLDRVSMSFEASRRAMMYHFENLSTIPDILKFRVRDSAGSKIIGTLDQKFVGEHGKEGDLFVLRGMQWRVLSVDEKSFTVNAEQHGGSSASIPIWEGETIPVEYATARIVQDIRRSMARGKTNAHSDIAPGACAHYAQDGVIPAENFRSEGMVVLHACWGSRINSAVSLLLSSILGSMSGKVDARSDAYSITLSSKFPITKEMLDSALSGEYDIRKAASAALENTHNMSWHIWCVAKRFGAVRKDAIYSKGYAVHLYNKYKHTAIVAEARRELYHDKYDLEGAARMLDEIRSGRIRVSWGESDESRLKEILPSYAAGYSTDTHESIMKMVKARLAKTRHRLVCCRCGRWQMAVTTMEVGTNLKCPRCHARQITATFHADYDLPKLVQKRRSGEELGPAERRKLDRAWKVASLIENFGRKAVLVMSGRGIGADAAARILRGMSDEESIYEQIYNAEKQYARNRGYWD